MGDDSQSIVVAGFGNGDEGKGTTVHHLTWRHKAHTVVRFGGPQAFHRAVSSTGAKYVHSQFGSGTICGAGTHHSKNMVIDPDAILKEGEALMYELGIRTVFQTLTIHEDALVITPFQAIANRLREICRGAGRYGTVGIGVGETVLDSEVLGDGAIRAKDLGKPHLAEKLQAIQDRKVLDLMELICQIDSLPEGLRQRALLEAEALPKQEVVAWAVERFNLLASKVRIVDTEYLAKEILGRRGTVVFEGSQGVLLDRFCGFHPYTTKVRSVPASAHALLDECGYDGRVTTLGVLRTYHTRHGAGPFVSECSELTGQLPDQFNGDHRWQGSFRVGHLDLVVARYAIDACGGPRALDGLVITCADRIQDLGSWQVCGSYAGPDEAGDPSLTESIPVSRGDALNGQLERQERIGQLLRKCRPNLSSVEAPFASDRRTFAEFVAGFLGAELKVPVVTVSVGPTERDKVEM